MEEPAPPNKTQRNPLPFIVMGAVVLILCTAVGILAFKLYNASKITVPATITKKIKFTPHLPGKLPGNYKLDKTSFSLDGATLAYRATDPAGATIAFTEQPKPANLNFEDFYAEQLKDAKTLSDVPYPSVYGATTSGGNKMVSIVTPSTWIIATSRAPVSEQDLKTIAAGMP